MIDAPLLTTVLVNYNHSRFLPESLGSVIAQSRPPDELIIIDDKSTDNSVEIIESFFQSHPSVKLIKNTINQGCFANVNDGLQLANGQYIHFAAADDVFYPRMYEVGLNLLQNHRAALFSSRSAIIDEQGRNSGPPSPWAGFPSATSKFLSQDEVLECLMREDGWFMGNTAIFRKDDLLRCGGFPIDLESFSDGYLYRYLALKEGACFSSDVLAAWRRMDSGFASSVSGSPERYAQIIENGERRMLLAPNIFPARYVRRWKGRQEFELHRRALALARARASQSNLLTRLSWPLKEKLLATILLARFRPWDIAANIRQRIAMHRGRI